MIVSDLGVHICSYYLTLSKNLNKHENVTQFCNSFIPRKFLGIGNSIYLTWHALCYKLLILQSCYFVGFLFQIYNGPVDG